MNSNFTHAAALGVLPKCRFAMSLMELLAVVMLMGVLASSVAMRYGREILGDTGVRSKASELSIGLNQAQRAAIRSGIPHGVTFAGNLNQVQSWSVVRFDHDGTETVVDGPYTMAQDFTLSVDSKEIVFDFEGNGTSQINAQFSGPNRSWSVSVMPLTRMIHSQEVK